MRALMVSALACLVPICAARAQAPLSGQSVEELIAAVRAGQQTGGFTMRARLVTGTGRAGEETVVQVRAVGRRDPATSRLLYQGLWPAAVKGRAAYIQKDGQHAPGGFTFEPPDTVTPLTRTLLSEPFLDTAMSLEDLTEEFWSWPEPAAAGQATVEGRPCTNDRPPPARRRREQLHKDQKLRVARAAAAAVDREDRQGRAGRPAIRHQEGDQGGKRPLGAGEDRCRGSGAEPDDDNRGVERRARRDSLAGRVLDREDQEPGAIALSLDSPMAAVRVLASIVEPLPHMMPGRQRTCAAPRTAAAHVTWRKSSTTFGTS